MQGEMHFIWGGYILQFYIAYIYTVYSNNMWSKNVAYRFANRIVVGSNPT